MADDLIKIKVPIKDESGDTTMVETEIDPKEYNLVDNKTIGEKYVLSAAHRSEMAKLRNEYKELEAPDKVRSQLLQDDDFRAEALRSWDIDTSIEPGITEQQSKDLVKKRVLEAEERLTNQKVGPLETERDTLQGQVRQLRESDLRSQIVQAFTNKVKSSMLKSEQEGFAPPIVNFVRQYFEFDEDGSRWAVTEGRDDQSRPSFSLSTKNTDGYNYKLPEEFASDWIENSINKEWLLDQTQKGSGHPSGDVRTPTGVIRISREDAKDHSKYMAAEKRASELGGTVEYLD